MVTVFVESKQTTHFINPLILLRFCTNAKRGEKEVTNIARDQVASLSINLPNNAHVMHDRHNNVKDCHVHNHQEERVHVKERRLGDEDSNIPLFINCLPKTHLVVAKHLDLLLQVHFRVNHAGLAGT